MKFILLVFLGLTINFNSQAKLTCDQLDEMAEILDVLATELEKVDSIGVDGEIDVALGDVTSVLNDVALVENDKRLKAWITDLEIAWEDMEKEDFEISLDDIIGRLDDLYDRDCDL